MQASDGCEVNRVCKGESGEVVQMHAGEALRESREL